MFFIVNELKSMIDSIDSELHKLYDDAKKDESGKLIPGTSEVIMMNHKLEKVLKCITILEDDK